jgi:hypothetical protein
MSESGVHDLHLGGAAMVLKHGQSSIGVIGSHTTNPPL